MTEINKKGDAANNQFPPLDVGKQAELNQMDGHNVLTKEIISPCEVGYLV